MKVKSRRLGIDASRVNRLILPAILVVAVITQVPMVVTLVLSVLRWIVVRPDIGISFVGIDNYVEVLSSPEFYEILLNTIVLTVSVIVACTVLGLCFALLLNRRFLGVNVLRTLFIAPFFVMDAVAGIIWKTLVLHPSFGINAIVAGLFGLPPADFLGNNSMLTIIVLVVWQWTPFFVLILLAGLENIPEEIVESAKIDGAGWFTMLFKIKIPVIANYFEVAIMLGLVFVLKTFGIIYVTTSGGPGTSSTNLPFIVYRTGFYRWDEGIATAMAVLTVILTIVSIGALARLIQRTSKEISA